jgi:CRISPR type IV-associated DEAD/DEAH-box helicase Csf4
MSAVAKTEKPDASAVALADDLLAIGLLARDEQVQMAGMLQKVHDAGGARVGFVEAPTATGKTVVMAQHALRNAADTGEVHVIAAPTIEVCHQTMAAISRLQDANTGYRRLTARIVLGRQEFVSQRGAADLAEALRDDGKADAAEVVETWYAAGGPGPTASHAGYTRKGLETALSTRGHEVTIPDWADLTHAGESDPADAEHASQFEDADVLVVTHSMLSRDLIKRYIGASKLRKAAGIRSTWTKPTAGKTSNVDWWKEAAEQRLQFEADAEGRLPDYKRLLVDEAHLLRANLEAALTTSVSIRQIVANVEEVKAASGGAGKVGSSVLPRLRSAQDALSSHTLMRRGEALRINWLEDKGIGDLLEEIKDALDQVKIPKTPATGAQREISRARYALREALGARNSVRTMVEWSPSRSYPSFSVGPRSLGAELAFLWGRLESAAAVSATLYTENKDGSAIRYMAELLGVGPDARMAFDPIRATWITDSVTVHTPGRSSAFLQPAREGEARDEWIRMVSIAIAGIQEEDDRGLLVLSTSRDMTGRIHDALAAMDDIGTGRLIDGRSGRMGGNKAVFESMARQGERPIWITQGPAWTGLDLADDTIGTLVIPKLPFPPPRPGDTKGAAATYDGEQVARMMMTLKQGLGRLVRSRTPSRKRAYLLDARIDGVHAARAANGLLDQYRRERF